MHMMELLRSVYFHLQCKKTSSSPKSSVLAKWVMMRLHVVLVDLGLWMEPCCACTVTSGVLQWPH